MTNQQMHVCKHVQSRIISLQQHVSITPTTIISVSHNKNTTNIQIIVKHWRQIRHYFSLTYFGHSCTELSDKTTWCNNIDCIFNVHGSVHRNNILVNNSN